MALLPVRDIPGGPVAAGSTPLFTATVADHALNPIPGYLLNSMRLSIVDTLSGNIINGAKDLDIFNTALGSVDNNGVVSYRFRPGDATVGFPEWPKVMRSIILIFTYNNGTTVGAYQGNFIIESIEH